MSAPASRAILPVATTRQVRTYARELMRRHPRELAVVVGLHGAAALAGLGLPWLVGTLVQSIKDGTTTSTVDRIALVWTNGDALARLDVDFTAMCASITCASRSALAQAAVVWHTFAEARA